MKNKKINSVYSQWSPCLRGEIGAAGPCLALLFSAASCLFVASCSGPATPSQQPRSALLDAPAGAAGVTSSTPVERYFPLVDGIVYSYATENDTQGSGVLIARVHRVDATHGELIFPTGRKRFSYAADGVHIEPTGDLVLAAPVVRGATFRGQNGGQAIIAETGLAVTVRAGGFTDCVRVVEERGGDLRARFTTTFCPDVGIVVIEAQSGEIYERAELVSAGPAVQWKDGVTVEPGPAPP